MINDLFYRVIGDTIWLYFLVPLFFAVSIYLSYKTGFIQIRYIRETWSSLFERTDGNVGITPWQAFSLSMSGRIGVGNVIGVAYAISYGGPGAVFWMWVIAFLSMGAVFIESILAQLYKVKKDDLYHGGPSYYTAKGLNSPKFGAFIALVVIIVFGLLLNMVQSNLINNMITATYQVDTTVFIAIVLVILTIVIISGGLRRVSHITEIIIPIIILLYFGTILVIAIINIKEIPAVFILIVQDAFGTKEMFAGGFASAIIQGTKRGLLFNGTGMGSASIAAATANTRHPAKQGLLQSLGVFIDTFVVSGLTAFVILLSGLYASGAPGGLLLAQAAITVHLGEIAPYYMSIILLLTSFAAIMANYYYGASSLYYLTRNTKWLFSYRIFVLVCLLLGTAINIEGLWSLVTLVVGAVTIINLAVITLLSSVAIKVWKNYLEQKKQGIVPRFYSEDIPGLTGTECWNMPEEMKDKGIEDAYFKAMPD
ncbi:alanine/glycine:cation symporter family protein [Ignatzschineria sp. LJL83]